MAQDGPLKGILKNALHGHGQSNTAATRKLNPRDLAIHHARILQHRKDLEARILDSVILLSEYPHHREPRYSASAPSPSDAADFKSHVRLFQPGDYEDLIEERNANLLCGYTLCSQPKPEPSRGGEWKLVNVGRPGFAIVDRKESERWCSTQCKERAMYVKVQLNETAAWERAGMPDIRIDLLGEEAELANTSSQLAQLKLEEEEAESKVTRDKALALERGEGQKDVAAGMPQRMMKLTIRENENTEMINANEAEGSDDDDDGAGPSRRVTDHRSIEGYTPRSMG